MHPDRSFYLLAVGKRTCRPADVVSLVSPQVIPKPGRTNLSPETQTTWWVRTVCPCSSTTSEEGDSWSVTECDNRGTLPTHPPSPPLLCVWGGGHCWRKWNLILTSFTVPGNLKQKKKKKRSNAHKESRRSAAPPQLYSSSFSFIFSVL